MNVVHVYYNLLNKIHGVLNDQNCRDYFDPMLGSDALLMGSSTKIGLKLPAQRAITVWFKVTKKRSNAEVRTNVIWLKPVHG